MKPPPEKNNVPLSTLLKGLQILEFIAKAEKLVRLRDVAVAFSMDRSTALRFLQTLQKMEFIEKYDEFKAYSAGPKLAELHRPKPASEKLLARVKPHLSWLANVTGQNAHLGVLKGNNAILVGLVPSPGRITIKQAVGDLEPLYYSAVGKAIYAFLPDEERMRCGQAIKFVKLTKRTIIDLETLEREAKLIRDSGVAFDDSEGSEDVCCIACPIFDKNKSVLASIGISMVAGLVKGSLTEQHQFIEAIREVVKDIEADGSAL